MPKYSQVFLKDVRMCETIASALEPEGFRAAVEIGPGRGALTEFLRPLWGDKLSVVEIDPLMNVRLAEKFPGLRIDNSDFMALDLEAIETGIGTGKGIGEDRQDGFHNPVPLPVAFIGNLPYECSTAILMKVLASSRFGAAVFMFQREVARKITAGTGDPDYGYLSVAVQAQSEASLLADVPAGSFSPVPEVDSSVLVFRPRTFSEAAKVRGKPRQTFLTAEHRINFLNFVKNAFSHRRKTLLNSLSMGLNLDKAGVEPLIKAAGFDPRLRPQNLSVEDYLKLSAAFGRGK